MQVLGIKNILTKVLFVIMVVAMCSCETGYSKKSYISQYRKLVEKAEKEYASCNDEEWENILKKNKALDYKYDDYKSQFDVSEKKEMKNLRWRFTMVEYKRKILVLGSDSINGIIEESADFPKKMDRWLDSVEIQLE